MTDKRKKKKPPSEQRPPDEQLPEGQHPPEEHDLESTLTEMSPGGVTPPGPPIELPKPEQKQPLEIGPPQEAGASDETHTDVLRVVEFNAADTEEPVSQPPAAPDHASGTQPSLSSEETRTDVFRPDEAGHAVREQVFDEREADVETGTDVEFRPAERPASDPQETSPEAGIETGTDMAPAFSVHDKETEELDEFPEIDGAGETRTDLGPPITHFVPAEPAAEDLPDEEEEQPPASLTEQDLDLVEDPQEPEPQPEPRGRSLGQRLKAFLTPRSFFKGVREDLKAFKESWTRSGMRKSSALVVDKNADWWRRTVLEILALFAIVVPIEMVLNNGRIGAFGVHPHPYWLIVLPMAGARGVVASMLAAAFASVLYVIGAHQALGQVDLFTFEIMMGPILFFGVGFFAGELHDELALRHRKVSRRLDEVRDRNIQLRRERDVLADANKVLERRIVDQSVQFGNLVVAATRIENAGRNEVFEIALDLVEEHTGAAASVLLLLDDGSIDYLSHSWPDDQLATRLGAARRSEFIERVIRDGVAINGFSPEESGQEDGPLCIAPLFDDNGLVKAMLCLDEIPASRLNESSMTIFFGIAEWLNAALVRLAKTATKTERSSSPHTGPMGEVFLGHSDQLGERLRLEIERCARYGVPTSFLAIQAPEWTDTTHDGVETIDRFICVHFTGGLRPSDTIYKFGYPGCYLLVLAGTTVEGAEVVRTRLLRRVQYAPSQHVGSIEIFATGPDAEAPDLLSLVERVASRFRAASPLALDGGCPVKVPEGSVEGDVNDFIRHLRMETSLATRNSFPLSVASITAETPQTAEAGLLARHVLAAGGRTLRPTDGVFAIGPNQCVVVLPCTTEEEGATVAHRLATAVRARDPDAPYGNLETHVLALGAEHVDVSSFLEALARQGETHE